MARILLTHPTRARENYYGDEALARLRDQAEVRLNPTDRPLGTRELIDAARDCDVIIADRQTPGEAELFRSLPNLVALSRCAIDIRNIDVVAASDQGILVTQASAGFIVAVAEWTIGVMLDLGRHISPAVESYHAGQAPVPMRGRELKGSTLGVIGYGQIGRYLCDLGLALGMRVVVFDPHVEVARPGVRQADLPELLATADHVVCLAPATAETENLMNAEAFARMKRDAVFINASRGELVDESALAHALDTGLIAGCALDVGRAPDQMPSPALARHPKVVATPHIGGFTPQAVAHQALETVAQVTEILQGRIPSGAVNAAAATRLARLQGAAG